MYERLSVSANIQDAMFSSRNQHLSALLELKDLNDSGADSSSDKFSPCRTRSGRIYTSVEKKKQAVLDQSGLSLNKSAKSNPSSSASKLPTPGEALFFHELWGARGK